MTRRRCWLRIVVVLALVIIVTAKMAEVTRDAQTIETINAARCMVRCLTLLQGRLSGDGSKAQEKPSLARCQLDNVCSECSRPCSESFVSVKQCEEQCKGVETECQDSCRFLSQVNTIRPGTCPPETQATGFAAICINSCDNDAECQEVGLKCCSNACGWTCQVPTHVFEGMPDVPSAPTLSQMSSTDGVQLRWNAIASNTTGTVLFLVDAKSSLGKQATNHGKTVWNQVAKTTDSFTVLDDLRPAYWYQFRVSAVNIYGSRGPSGPTQPFTLSKDPDKPGPPTNLTDGDSIITDGKVALTVHWSPPLVSDLPVSRYKIYWSKRLKSVSPQFHSMPEYRQVLPVDRLSYRIMDLDPDATYFIQVQAIVQNGDVRLKSDKASLYITTYPLPRSSNRVFLSTHLPIGVTINPLPTPPIPYQLTVVEIYFQNGLLKANVSWNFEEANKGRDERPDKMLIYWSTDGCSSDLMLEEPPVMSATTHVNYFTIYDLRFSCRYLIRVQAVTLHGITGTMAYIFLDTPPCRQAVVIGEFQPDCPRNAQHVPSAPTDMHYKFIVSNRNVSARLSWNPPSVATPTVMVYRVVRGVVMTGSHYLLMDKAAAVYKDVPKDVHVLILGDLLESTTYAVSVQAISRTIRGRVMSLRFTTPDLQPTVVDPSYVDIGNGRVDSVRQNAIQKKFDVVVSRSQKVTSFYFPSTVATLRDYSRPVKQVLNPPTLSSSSSATHIRLHCCLFLTLQILSYFKN